MNKLLRTGVFIVSIGAAVTAVSAMSRPADVASRNLSLAADNFEVPRKISVVNGITDNVSMVMEGYCSLGNQDKPGQLSITCKMEDGKFIKNFFIKSDNTFVLVEQLANVEVSTFQYRVMFRPQSLIPDVDFQGDASEIFNPSNADAK